MAKKKVQIQLRLDNMRTSFCKIWEAEGVKPGDKPAFSCHFIFEDGDPQLKKVKQAVRKLCHAKWGSKNGDSVLRQLMKRDLLCLHNGNDKVDGDGKVMEGYEDKWYISARSYVPPTIVDLNPKIKLTEEDGKIFSGCFVNCYLSLWVQTGQYGKRINAQMQGVQFRKTGDSFGGGKAADPGVFDTLADEFAEDENFMDFDSDDIDDADKLVTDFDDDILL